MASPPHDDDVDEREQRPRRRSSRSQVDAMTMQDIAALPENALCADCGEPNPNWTSINLGIFICIHCAGIHRNLGVHISKVRSIDLDTTCWAPSLIEFMLSMGNARSRALYEAAVPAYVVRPRHASCSDAVREHWIRAKYVRKEFVERPAPVRMPEEPLFGYLRKQSPKNKSRFQTRFFVQHGPMLSYFKRASDSLPCGQIDLASGRVVVDVPGADGGDDRQTNLDFTIDTPYRTFTLTAPNADALFAWAQQLRRAAAFYAGAGNDPLLRAGGADPIAGVNPDDGVWRGSMMKQGGARQTWRRRHFVLCSGPSPTLLYYKEKPDGRRVPEGFLPLGGAALYDACVSSGRKHCFAVLTRTRQYFLQAMDTRDMADWMKAIQGCIDKATPVHAFDVDLVEPAAARAP
ncbi:unnamed protein product (mitochondrion) [Plasmodiophora brassicae]|uniref:Arf-GAP domain-containing protein n=1 Tax=Plasmodiophora brassicae TaxID=37360 RepID=A0A0G4J681_PLABS|nr:hypothetical protein PBRA_009308 [Plasmodiophora brassicae]SPR01750.1 unnamed protein product [Plasmodiophora brassicae]